MNRRDLDRAVSPVVAVAVLAFLTVLLGVIVVTTVPSLSAEPVPAARLTVTADSATDSIRLTHHSGESLDVSALSVRITIDGTELRHQPPVPFFATTGFEGGPTGPFNTASPNTWQVGQTAGLQIASTNSPQIDPGDTVSVRIATDRSVVSRVTTEAR